MDSDLRHFSGSVCSAEPGPALQSTKWVRRVLRSKATLKLQAASASAASRSQIHFVLDCEFIVVIALSETLSCCQIPHAPPFSCQRSHHTCLRSWLESILTNLLTYYEVFLFLFCRYTNCVDCSGDITHTLATLLHVRFITGL